MRYSKLFLPTLKESPADAEVVSHKLMVRAGMIRKTSAGIYNLLPLGVMVLARVEAVVREEMVRAGAQEVLMPIVVPAQLWQESGRWDDYGSELLRIKDRHGRDFCLGPTHEEVVTDMVKGELNSYKKLPVNLFQIQTKFRDEIRPRFGLMRGREFIMKDAYSFHANEQCAEREYFKIFDAYTRIFERLGLVFRVVEADSGAIGGSFSHEFMVLADTGEDAVVCCTQCDYSANVERADIGHHDVESVAVENAPEPEVVSTPGKKSIEEVSEFLGLNPDKLIKTLIFDTDSGPVAVLARGDHDINPLKVKRALGAKKAELASEHTVEEVTGAPSGFAGPVGLKIPVIADWSLEGITGLLSGANKKDTHIRNICPARDFKADYHDLRAVRHGDNCPKCNCPMELSRGIEVGHIFMLGTKYSESMGCNFLDKNGKKKPMIMGCYGIGIGRSIAAAIEQNHDDAGIIWPKPLAPFAVVIVPVNMKDDCVIDVAEQIYSALIKKGLDVLIDDRKERPGVKFKDLDLIGIPVRVAVSTKTLASDCVEIKERASHEDPRLVKRADLMAVVSALVG